MKKLFLLLVVAGVAMLGLVGYQQTVGHAGSNGIPAMRPAAEQADAIRVFKARRLMQLLRDDEVLREYRIALGDDPEGGHKQREGDERTPEGHYLIDWRNPNSIAHLSLHISYPNDDDRQRARAAEVDPGGAIMIHGLMNGRGWIGSWHTLRDWTNGCIAVTNREIEEIWSLVADGTPIEILP